MSSFSVNLTAAEWSFILEELHQRRSNDLEPAYINFKSGYVNEFNQEDTTYKDIEKLLKLSNKITKKIENREKPKPSTKNQLINEISKLKKEIEIMDSMSSTKSSKIVKLETENCELKKQIDKQHEELQIIKDKIKSIISS
tara:strand:+ start:364 stop:786 length:423 start_codon:yes stop_codon:yes gene_type:complete